MIPNSWPWLENTKIPQHWIVRISKWKFIENNWKIIAFWRIFNIWENDYELSSLLVDDNYRWKKLWIELINDLLKEKFDVKNNLFLACKKDLEYYYKNIYFNIIERNIPEKLKWTLNWWKGNNFYSIIMKYKI